MKRTKIISTNQTQVSNDTRSKANYHLIESTGYLKREKIEENSLIKGTGNCEKKLKKFGFFAQYI